MRELAILSGKGGTGKTSVAASFAMLAGDAVIVDCDVDAPNLAIVLEPEIRRSSDFIGGETAVIDPDACTLCDECRRACAFNAIEVRTDRAPIYGRRLQVVPACCEGCGVCLLVCEDQAIRMVPAANGRWFDSVTRAGRMIHARLGPAQDNSGKLVTHLRKEARSIATRDRLALILSDGPPGIGCPVIAAVGGADMALVITEPTVSGLHDLRRTLELTNHFRVPAMVVVNRFDISPELTEACERWAIEQGAEVAGRIPYDEAVVAAQMNARAVVEYGDIPAARAVRAVWDKVACALKDENLDRRRAQFADAG